MTDTEFAERDFAVDDRDQALFVQWIAERDAKAARYTHTGYRPHCGRIHTSNRLAGHTEANAGKVHALRANGIAEFIGLCGETVRRYEETVHGDEITDHVQPASAGVRVSCARCRKLLGLREYAVQFRLPYSSRWATVKGHGHYATKAEAETAKKAVESTNPGNVLRVRAI